MTILAGLLLTAVILGTLSYKLFVPKAEHSRLPPGPARSLLRGTPIPTLYPWRFFHDLSKQYGPVVTIWRGNQPLLVCNDVASTEFILEKNARITADRPRAIAADEIVSHGKRILLVGYNDRWRRLRKALHHTLQPQSSRNFRPVQEKAARTAIMDILAKPEDFQKHIQSYTATVVVNLAYGRSDKANYADPDIQEVIQGSHRLGTLLRPGAIKLDSYPWLRYVPGYLSTINKWADDELRLFRGAYQQSLSNVQKGNALPCFVSYILEKREEFGLNDDEIAYLCGSIFGAGSDTSSSAITLCIMAAAVYPHAQARVQEELDRVVGRDRPPTFEDWQDLPILKAFIAETYRWRPVSSGGFTHKTTEDLAFEQYLIPKGTSVVGNHWGIHRDESYYGPDVENFNIDRFLTNDGAAFNEKLKLYQFGFGRRVCPGQHVANASVYINAALLLWAFNIGKYTDERGVEAEIDTLNMSNTANSHPLPFKVSFVPRILDLSSVMKALS